MRDRVVAFVIISVLAFGAQVTAHHSFAATYREDERIRLEGEVVQLQLRNPHSFLRLMVRQHDGSQLQYGVEWEGAGQLAEEGVTAKTLKPGDLLVITGSPARRREDRGVRLVSLRRPKDGFSWMEGRPFLR